MGVWRWGEREIIYLSLHCHHQNDFCIKMGSDERHFKSNALYSTLKEDGWGMVGAMNGEGRRRADFR